MICRSQWCDIEIAKIVRQALFAPHFKFGFQVHLLKTSKLMKFVLAKNLSYHNSTQISTGTSNSDLAHVT